MNNTCLFKKEDEFLSKITEINIKIDKDNVPLSHHLHKNDITPLICIEQLLLKFQFPINHLF